MTKERKRSLLAELERYGVISKVAEDLDVSEDTLERLLQEIKGKHDASNKSRNWFIDLYESAIIDYFTILTVATVFFLSYNPWVAIFWQALLLL